MADKFQLSRKEVVLTAPPLLLCMPTFENDRWFVISCVGLAWAILVYGCFAHEGRIIWKATVAAFLSIFLGFVAFRAYDNSVTAEEPALSIAQATLKKSDNSDNYEYSMAWENTGKTALINPRGVAILDFSGQQPSIKPFSISGETQPSTGNRSFVGGIAIARVENPFSIIEYIKYNDAKTGRRLSQCFYFHWDGVYTLPPGIDLPLASQEEAATLQQQYQSEFDKIK